MEETIDLRQLFQVLLRRKWLIVLLVIVAMGSAYISSRRMTPIYQATASILVRDPGSAERMVLETLTGTSRNQVQNYVEILRSRTLALRAAELMGHDYDVHESAFQAFRSSISVSPVSGTETIRISAEDADPARAARIANAVAEAFIEFSRDMNRQQAAGARMFIEEQLQIVEQQLVQTETALQTYRESERVLAPSEETRIVLGLLSDLEARHAETQLARDQAMRRLDEVRRRLAEEEPSLISSTTISNNPLVSQQRTRLATLETELAGLLENFNEQHPQVVALRAQMREVEAQISREVERIVTSETRTANPLYQSFVREVIELETESMLSASRLAALSEQIRTVEGRLASLPEKELTLARLMRDQNVAEDIYLLLRNRYEEVRITEAMQTADVSILDPSIVPRSPVRPRVMLNVAIAAFLGVFVGVGIAFVLEFMDTTLKTPEEVESFLDLPVMGRIPVTGANE